MTARFDPSTSPRLPLALTFAELVDQFISPETPEAFPAAGGPPAAAGICDPPAVAGGSTFPPDPAGTLPSGGASSATVDGTLASPAAPGSLDHGGLKVEGAAGAFRIPASSSEATGRHDATPRERTRLVDALNHVLEQRQRQLEHGHTLDRDMVDQHSERRLLQLAQQGLTASREDVTLRPGGRNYRAIAIRHAAKAAALLVAFIEVQLERADQDTLEPETDPIEQGKFDL